MYGIDINFLNDRADRPVDAIVPVAQSSGSSASKVPIIAGLVAGLACVCGVGGFWFIQQNQQKTLQAEAAELDSQLAELQQKISEIDTVRQQTQAINTEIQGLAGVFEQIRPWSAIVRDVQGRIPSRTQLSTIVQVAFDPEAQGEEGETREMSPAGGIRLTGNACSFDDVNDFMLTLKNSPFLVSETVEITTASLGQPVDGRCPGQAEIEIETELVSYTITSDIKSIPAATLLDELNRQQEATGLAARIRALQATGAID